MVAVLLKLKLAHFLASFRQGNPWVVVGLIFGLLYALGFVAMIAGLGVWAGKEAAYLPYLVLAGALLTLVWWVLPIFASAADATLDPERLAPYPIKPHQLMLGQFFGAFIGLPGLATLLLTLVTASSLLSAPLGLVFFPLTVLLGLGLAVVVSRLVTLVSIPLRARRGVSNTLTLLASALLIFTGPLIMGLTQGIGALGEKTFTLAAFLQWTPLGSAWGISAAAAEGNLLRALTLTGLSLVYLALGWFAWQKATWRTMLSVGDLTPMQGTKALENGQLGIMGRFADQPRWAIAARVLHSIVKDSRYGANFLGVLLFYVLYIFMMTLGNNPAFIFFLLVFNPAYAGYLFAYLIPYENTAFSLHVLAPLRGIEDRLGRVYALSLLFVPMIGVGTVVSSLLAGRSNMLLADLALTFGVFAAGLGIAAISDMLFSVPVAPPGSTPWKTPKQPDGMAKTLVRGLTMLVPMAFAIPGFMGMFVSAVISENLLWAYLGSLLTLALGLGMLTLGVRRGASLYDRNAALVLQRVARFN
ncbi:MAG: hypothetical protein Q3965_02980 [Rothia sp. (in: high G+C Gram-positive bacteria)]|nr:hypothetical protein [Rothia sp. (in: high G+C Gram-positive bacteria)]